MTNSDREAMRRINNAADLIRSAIRLGADAEYVARAVRSAVAQGAEQYAADVEDTYAKATS